jgi:hypothetical protein
MKTRDYKAVRVAVEKALEDNADADFDYFDNGDGREVFLGGWYSIPELKAIIAGIESVPLE